MAQELTHRAGELKELGWNQEDLNRYIELWDYRQRWGAINLEREDRQFLRKAESLLPAISKAKVSVKKPLHEKSYYRWLKFFLNEMNAAEVQDSDQQGKRGLWPIILEEEIRAIEYYQPVLGLPDTIKAKLINPLREELVKDASVNLKIEIKSSSFDFQKTLKKAKSIKENNSWRSIRGEGELNDTSYPLIDDGSILEFRKVVSNKLLNFIRENFPSLAETEKPIPSESWLIDNNQ